MTALSSALEWDLGNYLDLDAKALIYPGVDRPEG